MANQLFDKIIDQSIINGDLLMTEEKEEFGVIQKRCDYQVGWVEMDR